jgi:hypothetical protein
VIHEKVRESIYQIQVGMDLRTMLKTSEILYLVADIGILLCGSSFLWHRYLSGSLLLAIRKQQSQKRLTSLDYFFVFSGVLIIVLEKSITLSSIQLLIFAIVRVISRSINPEIRQKGLLHQKLYRWHEFEYYTWKTREDLEQESISELPSFVFSPSDSKMMVLKSRQRVGSEQLFICLSKKGRQGYLKFAVAPSQQERIDSCVSQFLPQLSKA